MVSAKMACVSLGRYECAKRRSCNTSHNGYKGGDEQDMRFLWRLLRRLGRKSSGYEITLWPGNKVQYKKVITKRGV